MKHAHARVNVLLWLALAAAAWLLFTAIFMPLHLRA